MSTRLHQLARCSKNTARWNTFAAPSLIRRFAKSYDFAIALSDHLKNSLSLESLKDGFEYGLGGFTGAGSMKYI